MGSVTLVMAVVSAKDADGVVGRLRKLERGVMMANRRRHRWTEVVNVFAMNASPNRTRVNRGSLGTFGEEIGVRRGDQLPEKRRDGTTRERIGSRGAEGQVGVLGEGGGIVTSEGMTAGIVLAEVKDFSVGKEDGGGHAER